MNPSSILLPCLPLCWEAGAGDHPGPAWPWSFQGRARPPQGRQAEAGTKVGDQSGWAGASLGLPPRFCGSSIVALTKAALFLPTTIPCQHPSAFRLQISCPLAAFQEAARAQNVDGKRISGAGWWKVAPCCGVQAGTGPCGGASLQKPEEQGSGVRRSGPAAPPRSPSPCIEDLPWVPNTGEVKWLAQSHRRSQDLKLN